MSYFKYDSHFPMNNTSQYGDDDLRKAANKFLKKYNLFQFDLNKWYNKAYNAVSFIITLNGGRNDEWKRIAFMWNNKNSEQLKEDIFNLLKELTVAEVVYKIGELARDYELPVGIVQKIVSLLIKYIFCHYVVFGDSLPNAAANTFTWVKDEKVVGKLPIPIDSKVLCSLSKMGNTSLNITEYRGIVKIGGIPWSRIGLDDYKKIQDTVRKLSVECKMSPIEFEIKKLWK